MLKHAGETLFSASDLVNFMGCSHATFLDLRNLLSPVSFPPDDDMAILLQQKGFEHEHAFLARLKAEGKRVIEIPGELPLEQKVDRTREALRQRPDVIYQGAFLAQGWHGYSDFLLRVDRPSALGDYSYEVADTKLSRTAKPKHLIQMCVYADLLAAEQGIAPEHMHVVLGDGTIATTRVDQVIHYYRFARDRFRAFAESSPVQSAAVPCGHCAFCRWSPMCQEEWEKANHLSIVAGMSRGQAEALRQAGIGDLVALSQAEPDRLVPGMQIETFARLRAQARLQAGQRATGKRRYELLELEPNRGLSRLPKPDAGDIFFDMEGDPLFEGGIEYLFGLLILEEGRERFYSFWAHDREQEKKAFQQTMDFIVDRLARNPGAHVYHYAAYEETALKRLAMLHGTRETEVDDLLRTHKLVDLYRVARQAVRTSEPRYSLKNLEKFYLAENRAGEVTTAESSIVIYEQWRRLGEQHLLQEIEDYNRFDCSSTLQCRNWLVDMRAPELPWYEYVPEPAKVGKAEDRAEAEAKVAAMADALLAGKEGRQGWRQLLVDLLEFHKRENKPGWWSVFSRQYLSHDELLDDAECLAGLQPRPDIPPKPEKRSTIYSFRFPIQDFKLKPGDEPKRAGTLEPAGEIVAIDEDALTIQLKLGPTRSVVEPGSALIPQGPIGDAVLRDAVYRVAEAVRDGRADDYSAVVSILRRDLPILPGRKQGSPILVPNPELLSGTIDALLNLDRSYLLIQGPPGAGKTFTSSHAITALLARGMRIGIASNSHKAINQLLKEVEKAVSAEGLRVCGIKKSSREEQMLESGGWIGDTLDNKAISASRQLVAGTAWLFARPEHDQAFDYLFVDEAGQVGLANIVAMGTAAKNIVLVGDQMQLAQPIQGTHPRDSGVSVLQHLLQDQATVPPERGVFLSETRRMHPALCEFISEAVYEGRLRSSAGTEAQQVLADPALDPAAIAPAGLRFVCVDSLTCTQRSEPEAERLMQTYRALLGQSWRDRDGAQHKLGTEDILVVSPYNMQVELLKRTLPVGARVGTVDKFQGQEAAIVLVSMATSSGDDLPRTIQFLYSRNRLNVAISRAHCLAVIYANPRLLEIPCHSIEQMELVNGLCWARHFAEAQTRQAASQSTAVVKSCHA